MLLGLHDQSRGLAGWHNRNKQYCCFAGIEDLKEKREQILKQIQDEENEKQKIQQELAALTQRLSRINESLARKVSSNKQLPYLVWRMVCLLTVVQQATYLQNAYVSDDLKAS